MVFVGRFELVEYDYMSIRLLDVSRICSAYLTNSMPWLHSLVCQLVHCHQGLRSLESGGGCLGDNVAWRLRS